MFVLASAVSFNERMAFLNPSWLRKLGVPRFPIRICLVHENSHKLTCASVRLLHSVSGWPHHVCTRVSVCDMVAWGWLTWLTASNPWVSWLPGSEVSCLKCSRSFVSYPRQSPLQWWCFLLDDDKPSYKKIVLLTIFQQNLPNTWSSGSTLEKTRGPGPQVLNHVTPRSPLGNLEGGLLPSNIFPFYSWDSLGKNPMDPCKMSCWVVSLPPSRGPWIPPPGFLTKTTGRKNTWNQQLAVRPWKFRPKPKMKGEVVSQPSIFSGCELWVLGRVYWRFPKIVVPPNHPWKNRVFHYKSSILGHTPIFWKHPFSQAPSASHPD